MAEFIFMLTRDDQTVADARDVVLGLEDERLRTVGFKDVGLPFEELREIVEILHGQGRQVFLEIVSEGLDDELRSISSGVELGVDALLGGVHVEYALAFLAGDGQRLMPYYPFAGETRGHPTELLGPPEAIVESARAIAATPGVSGLDLLAYRFDGDASRVLAQVVEAVAVPVIAAGSIDSLERIRAVRDAGAAGFTVGTAAFDGLFVPGAPLTAQLDAILDAAAGGRSLLITDIERHA